MNFGLSQPTIDQINKVFAMHHSIEEVLIYGSRALGNYTNGSDIDLTIISQELDFTELLTIKSQLSNLLIPYKVDVSVYSQIDNEELKAHINEYGKQFYKRDAK
jgi:predicted nucleotidyltransferase